MEYPQAWAIYKSFFTRLAPACLQIEVVGSIKRADPRAVVEGVHDIEFLLIADPARLPVVFGGGKDQPTTKLEKAIAEMKAEGLISSARKKAEGSKQKRFAIVEHSQGPQDFCLELFIVKPETWAIQAVIRTGPRIFSKRFVMNENQSFIDQPSGQRYKGLLPNYLEYMEGETKIRTRARGEVLDLKTEAEAIDLLGFGWIPPDRRYQYT